MQSDPQDEPGPVSGGNDFVDPDATGPGSPPPGDPGPHYPVPADAEPEAPPPYRADPPPLPQMPGPPQASPPLFTPPPQMPGPPDAGWDHGAGAAGPGEAPPPNGTQPEAPHEPAAWEPAGQATQPGPVFDEEPSVADIDPIDSGQAYADSGQAYADSGQAYADSGQAYADAEPVLPAAPSGLATPDDWLERICPYLLSDDGTYRSTQADERHRCTAQEPHGNLPLAFQARYCLTQDHVRCEMYKYTQDLRAATLADDGVPAQQVEAARFRPVVRSVPLARGGGAAGDRWSRRPAVIGAAAFGGLILLVLVTLLLSGGGGEEDELLSAAASASPAVDAGDGPTPTPTPTPEPTPEPDVTPDPDATATSDDAATAARQDIRYEVQEDEALLKIAESFGTSRRKIINANEGMAEKSPYVAAGDIIIVPASADLTVEELEAFPGYLGPAESVPAE